MKIFTRYFHFKVISFDTFKLLKFVTFLHIDLCMQNVILWTLMNFGVISPGIHHKTCKISKNPNFQLNNKRSQSKGFAFALPLRIYPVNFTRKNGILKILKVDFHRRKASQTCIEVILIRFSLSNAYSDVMSISWIHLNTRMHLCKQSVVICIHGF